MSRTDMESASPRRHTLQAAVFEPEELSECCGVRGTRLVMMVDQTRREGEMVGGEAVISLINKRLLARCSGRDGKALSARLPAQPGRFIKGRMVAQRGVADARELGGQADTAVDEPALKRAARQVLGVNDAPSLVGDGDGELKTHLARSTATVVACMSHSSGL